jgi:hypothetical protein
MADTRIETVERLEELAAWHRAIAERAGAVWVWEARLRTAEDLERQAAGFCAQLASTGKRLSAGRVFSNGMQRAIRQPDPRTPADRGTVARIGGA